MAGVFEQSPVVLYLAAHQKGKQDAQDKHNDAENINAHLQSDIRGSHSGQTQCGRALAQHHVVQSGPQEKCGHTDGNGSGVVVIALVDIGRVAQTCRQEKADHKADKQSKAKAQPVKADIVSSGIAEQKIRNQGSNAGGVEHRIGYGAQFFFLHGSIQEYAQNGGDGIENIDTPRAEADGQQNAKGRHIVGFCTGQADKQCAEKTNQAHIQESGGVTAQSKVVGGDFTGLRHNVPQAGKHSVSVGHKECCHDK